MQGLHRLRLNQTLGHNDFPTSLHSCDTPRCFEAGHLSAGTQKQNAKDREARGRHRAAKGSQQGSSKLVEEMIPTIRGDTRTNVAIAKELGVTGALIGLIKARKIWKHV